MNTASQAVLHELTIATPDGDFVARYSELGLCELSFPTGKRQPKASPTLPPPEVLRWHKVTTKALLARLAGKAPTEFPPLDLRCGTAFQQQVWEQLRGIAAGKPSSYGELAKALGKTGAARAVGGACGANPIPVLIPCHRVLAGNQKLGGFSGGLDWKRRLLAREGLELIA